MSTWTHVNGSIRIDAINGVPLIPLASRRELEEHLGNTWMFEDDSETMAKCTVPAGSEGSLQFEISKVGDGLVFWTVAIWGDLRDFGQGEVGQIESWFSRVCSRKDCMVRSAVLEIETEGGGSRTILFWDEDHLETYVQVKRKPVEEVA